MGQLTLGQELTIAQAATARETLLQAMQDGQGTLVLDLSGVNEFDSAGVQLLLAARRSLQQAGRALALHQPSAAVRDALHCLGLQELLAQAAG
jgi:anti-anti-sigma factor